MDFTFWAGIVLGGLVGLPVTIIGNLYSDQVREYLGRRKALRLNKQRWKELTIHRRLLDLLSGDPRETLLLAQQRTLVVMALVMMLGCYTFVCAFLFLYYQPIGPYVPKVVLRGFAVAFSVLAMVTSIVGFVLFDDLRNTMRKLRRFSEYEEEIREQWGDDAI